MPFFGAPKDIQTFRITLKRDNNEWIQENRWLLYDEVRDFFKEINKKLKKYLDSQKIEYDTNKLSDRLIEVDNVSTDYMISRTCKRLKYSFYVGNMFGKNKILETVELTGQELFKKLTEYVGLKWFLDELALKSGKEKYADQKNLCVDFEVEFDFSILKTPPPKVMKITDANANNLTLRTGERYTPSKWEPIVEKNDDGSIVDHSWSYYLPEPGRHMEFANIDSLIKRGFILLPDDATEYDNITTYGLKGGSKRRKGSRSLKRKTKNNRSVKRAYNRSRKYHSRK